MVAENKIKAYGVSSMFMSMWGEDLKSKVEGQDDYSQQNAMNSLDVLQNFSLSKLMDIAKDVGGNNHGLRYIAGPFNTTHLHPLFDHKISTESADIPNSIYEEKEREEREEDRRVSVVQFCESEKVNFIGQNKRALPSATGMEEMEYNHYLDDFASLINLHGNNS
jgi:hypothetical protein